MYIFRRLMFGSLRSLWIFVDPTSKESNQNLDTITYEFAEDEIILQTNTEETIPAGRETIKWIIK